jgi:WD40 repeat protein
MLATASYADVRLLEVPSGRELARMTHSAEITALAFSPNSRFLATGGGTDPGKPPNPRTPRHDDRSARVWNTDLGTILERLCRCQGRNLGLVEWRSQFGDLPWQPTCKTWPIPADGQNGGPAAWPRGSPVASAQSLESALAKVRYFASAVSVQPSATSLGTVWLAPQAKYK